MKATIKERYQVGWTNVLKGALVIMTGFGLVSGAAMAAPFNLNNGPGDGTVSVGVDGYGAFGSSVGSNSTDATYDPVGAAPPPAGTSFESGVAIRFGASGGRTFLTSGDIGGSGGLTNPAVVGTSLVGNSSFTSGPLAFQLQQQLFPLLSGTSQTGTELRQTFTITNTGLTPADFELVRYLDGDLLFDGSLVDGGGRLFSGGTEILFETDSATGSSTATTFVGISAVGGTIPLVNRFEVDSYSGLGSRIVSGTALDDTITGDGADLDQFIDAGNGYDVTLALRNAFSLPVGGSTNYTTSTFFGSGIPESLVVPEPGTVVAGWALCGVVAATSFRFRRKGESAIK